MPHDSLPLHLEPNTCVVKNLRSEREPSVLMSSVLMLRSEREPSDQLPGKLSYQTRPAISTVTSRHGGAQKFR
jgi:hypothetical protein